MEQGAQVRVTGPSRVLLALSTGALVAVTSVATAVVVLSGTTGVTPGQQLEPRPPAAAAPGQPPVVVLPPGALGTGVPELGTRSRVSDGAVAGAPRREAGSPLVLSLAPELSLPVSVPAAGLLPPEPPRAAPAVALPADDAAVGRPGKRRGAIKKVLTAPLAGDATPVPTSDGPSDSLAGTASLLSTASGAGGQDADAAKDKAKRDRREFAAQERGRRLIPRLVPAAVPVPPAVPAVPAVPRVSPAVPATPAAPAARPSPASVDRKSSGKAAGAGSTRTQGSATKGERTKKPSEAKKTSKKKKASGSSSGRRAPQGGRGSGRGPRS